MTSDKPSLWYNSQQEVLGLADFMVGSGEMKSADELLHYFKNPEEYTEVYILYLREIYALDDDTIKERLIRRGNRNE